MDLGISLTDCDHEHHLLYIPTYRVYIYLYSTIVVVGSGTWWSSSTESTHLELRTVHLELTGCDPGVHGHHHGHHPDHQDCVVHPLCPIR